MKTTLIQIDPHDDLTSIKDKMTWAKSSRMLLFFPNGYPLDQSPLTMKLIRRYAETNGARVALVTRNRIMREIAGEQGIPCFASAPQAEKKIWPGPQEKIIQRTIQGAESIIKQKNGATTSQKKISPVRVQRIITLILLMILMSISSMLFIPSAKIIFFPELTTQEISYKVIADPAISTVMVNGNLPAKEITITVSGELAGDSTGKVSIPKSKATGEVKLVNLTAKSVILARGTIVSTGGTKPIEFYITTDISLPGSTNEAKTAPIEAVIAGAAGNVAIDTINLISGFEQSVAVSNSTPTKGGAEQSYPTPTDLDYQKLEIQLREQLLIKCKSEIKGNVPEDGNALESSVRLDELISRSQTPRTGEPSDRAILSLEISCSALLVDEKDENQLAKLLLDQDLPKSLLPLDNNILIERPSPISENSDGYYTWDATASRKLMQDLEIEKALKMISGKKIGDASEILSRVFLQTKEAEVTITPHWWKLMPILPGKIEVEFRSE